LQFHPGGLGGFLQRGGEHDHRVAAMALREMMP
jgi:hypothetical protein